MHETYDFELMMTCESSGLLVFLFIMTYCNHERDKAFRSHVDLSGLIVALVALFTVVLLFYQRNRVDC